MAGAYGPFYAQLCKVLENCTTLPTSLRERLTRLLVEPAKKVGFPQPVVIVVDALDECEGSWFFLKDILETIGRSGSPFRLFITSRPENELYRAFDKQFEGHSNPITSAKIANTADIQRFIESQLVPFGISLDRCIGLTALAGDLMIWASTVCRFIQTMAPVSTTDLILASPAMTDLDELYRVALAAVVPVNNRFLPTQIRPVLGVIVTALQPLSAHAINDLLGINYSQEVVRRLGCVLSNSEDEQQPIYVLHPTFREFITNRVRSGGALWIDLPECHGELGRSCVRLMTMELRFNICGLESSFLSNADIENLEERVMKFISEGLRYSSLYGFSHLCSGFGADAEVYGSLKEFLGGEHLLYWLEVLSLLGKVHVALSTLAGIRKWIGVRSGSSLMFPRLLSHQYCRTSKTNAHR